MAKGMAIKKLQHLSLLTYSPAIRCAAGEKRLAGTLFLSLS
jgi:hypothetical protein